MRRTKPRQTYRRINGVTISYTRDMENTYRIHVGGHVLVRTKDQDIARSHFAAFLRIIEFMFKSAIIERTLVCRRRAARSGVDSHRAR